MLYKRKKVISFWITIGCAILILLAPVAVSAADEPAPAPETQPSANTDENPIYLPSIANSVASSGDFLNCRVGVGVAMNSITTYNIAPLRLGWYVDWGTSKTPNTALDYYYTIRVRQDRVDSNYLPTYKITPPLNFSASGLGQRIQADPGATWLVGNEPDRVDSQDDTMPEVYAEIYHEVYHFIKAIDPTARVAIGAVVQPTPVRLEYLQRVLDTYRARYGTRLPVDLWNTHIYIIREVRGEWGGEIPPGIAANTGRVYTLHDHLDINIFTSLIVELRTWMKMNGYQDVPLIITEFGALMPLWFLADAGYTQADVNRFIRDAINYMESAKDPNLGYVLDDNRLVQQAALYSLDDDSTFSNGFPRWGSYLFNSAPPYALTATGIYFRDQIAAPSRPTVDLFPYHVTISPLFTGGNPTVSPSITVQIANSGNSAPQTPVTIRFFDLTNGQQHQIGSDIVIPPFTGCGTTRTATTTWPALTPGIHTLSIVVDPDNAIAEISKANNTSTVNVRIVGHGLYLPAIRPN